MSDITWRNETRKLSELVPWEHNPKQLTEAQGVSLRVSLDKFGLALPLLIDDENNLYDGHQRQHLLEGMSDFGPDAIIDVRVSSRPLTWDEQRELVIRLRENQAGWDFDALGNIYDVEELQEWGFPEWKLEEFMPDDDYESGVEDGAQPNPRNLPIDVIFTLENYTSQWTPMAYYSGLKWGIQSNSKVLSQSYDPHYLVSFVDNEYTEYKHENHARVVERFKPEYATVRDVMSKEQCAKAGITYYSLSQILDWAEELNEHAENVIVIPKYDCIDQIPEQYILGYSVPTSHGGTPLNVDVFRGRRVHLLGGSWKKQLEYMAALGDDVVSLDNNHCHRIAEFGQFYKPDGSTGVVSDLLDRSFPNGMTIALAISFGAMGAKINELYAGTDNPA